MIIKVLSSSSSSFELFCRLDEFVDFCCDCCIVVADTDVSVGAVFVGSPVDDEGGMLVFPTSVLVISL